ncbi:MAG: RluA family pseudouridine synthase [Oscillospiraceae bacterium]|nr:RluA family pseudouridine synthase [Oscillospiraceae bacterium]
MFLLTVGPNDAGQRLDKFLLKTLNNCPKSLLYKGNRQNKIKVNRKKVDLATFLNNGDEIRIFLGDEFAPVAKESIDPQKALPDPDVVYEDENILVINKPVGISAHSEKPGVPNARDMAVAYLIKTGAFSPDKEQSFTPAFANRLDRNTQGMMIMGKNAAALRELNALIAEDKVTKTYLCLTHKVPSPAADTLTGYIVKDKANNISKIVTTPVKDCKAVSTKYQTKQVQKDRVLIEVELLTGRSHQIRAHMASIGCPLLGDKKYGGKPVYKYQALCACRLMLQPDENSCLYYLKDKVFEVTPWFL